MTGCADMRFGSSPSSRSEPAAIGSAMEVHPIGFVESSRATAEDDGWGSEQACIRLSGVFSARALEGLAEFSHVEVLFVFHQVDPASVILGARHPRNNPSWPAVGLRPARQEPAKPARQHHLPHSARRRYATARCGSRCNRWDPGPRSEAGDAGISAARAGTATRVVA